MSWARIADVSAMVIGSGGLRARVRILHPALRNGLGLDDLEGRGLPLDEDHRVGDLESAGIDLELPEEVHDVHAAKGGPDLERRQTVRLHDRVREHENGGTRFRGVVGRGCAAVQGSIEGSELCGRRPDRKSTRLNSSHITISYAVFCLKKK